MINMLRRTLWPLLLLSLLGADYYPPPRPPGSEKNPMAGKAPGPPVITPEEYSKKMRSGFDQTKASRAAPNPKDPQGCTAKRQFVRSNPMGKTPVQDFEMNALMQAAFPECMKGIKKGSK